MIGHPIAIIDGVAAIAPESGSGGDLLPHVPLRSLVPHYLPRDNVKDCWSDSCGIVLSVDKDHKTLVYVEKDSVREVHCV